MPAGAPSIPGPSDARTGSGYGTLRKPSLGADSQAGEVWPYIAKTKIEIAADNDKESSPESRRSLSRKTKQKKASDHLAQLNHKPHSFVNGSTRGLTGIMSGVDARAVLEQFVIELTTVKRRRPRENIKPFGTGAPALSTMSTDPTTRTRPGMTLGSKQGWFSPPPPKDSDPASLDHADTLHDIAIAGEDRAVRFADFEAARVKRKNVKKENVRTLRSYVQIVITEPLNVKSL